MLIKGLLKKLLGKVIKNKIAAEVIADKADDLVTRELDKRTGGAATKAEELAARVKATRL